MKQADWNPDPRAKTPQLHKDSDETRERGEPTRLINALVVDRSMSSVERIVRSLRDHGHVVQHHHTTELREIQQALNNRPLDIIVLRLDMEGPSLQQVVDLVERSTRDIPLLAYSEAPPEITRLEALQNGATDLVSGGDTTLLGLVAQRQIQELEKRRRGDRADLVRREAEQRCRELLAASRDGIAYVQEGMHVLVNQAYVRRFGFRRAEELEGLPVMNLVTANFRQQLKQHLKEHARGDTGIFEMRVNTVPGGGDSQALTLELLPSVFNQSPCTRIVVASAQGEKQLQRELADLRRRDELTGVFKRRHFEQLVGQAMQHPAPDRQSPGALFYVLLTGLRLVQVEHGFATSDQLRASLAKLLSQDGRTDIQVGHLSDSVFALLTRDSSVEQALQRGNELCRLLSGYSLKVGDQELKTTFSMGITMLDPQRGEPAALIAEADRACEIARRQGPDQVHLYRDPSAVPEQDLRAARRLLEDTVRERRLTLFFQPVVSVRGQIRRRFSVEVRVRTREDLWVAPGKCFDNAEELGLNGILDRWTLRYAAAVAERFSRGAAEVSWLVPVSINSVGDPAFMAWVQNELKPSPGMLIEVSEPAAEHHARQTAELALWLRERGLDIALSHAGARDHSTRLIRQLRPALVRLDATLTERLAQDDAARHYLSSVADAVRSHGGLSVATGITTARQLAAAWQTSVDLVQGEFLGPAARSLEFDFSQFQH